MQMQTQMSQPYSYQSILSASHRANWQIEDVIGGDRRLDFTRPFMPESLARVEPLAFLQPAQRLALNQIRGNGYLHMFGVCEEFILPFVMDQARPQLSGDDDERVRAMLGFAGEEAKHMQLFKRFSQEFEAGFGTRCPVIQPGSAIAQAVLAHQPLAVALLTLHIEWMTQRHYVDSVKDAPLDPQFASLLRHHWMEESQHAKLDTLLVEALARTFGEGQIMRAIDEYLEIGGFLDSGLRQQVEMDVEALRLATGRMLTESERSQFIEVQLQALRWTYIGSGITHPQFLATVGRLSPAARTRLEQVAPAFC
jgi:hypothetical protein